ncbi:MAG: ABC transporter permease, partial [Acidobacteria bacterium]|nr:ABC transporter permease [Acidobacteriota bacterium]
MKAFLKRLRSLWRPEQVRDEIGEEFRFHIEEQIADNLRRAMSPEDSRSDAQRRFGALARIREEGYEARSLSWVESLLQDSIYGLRLMRRNPGFSAAAVLTLALGIGANTAIFSVVNAVLLRPLPYPDSGRLVVLQEKTPSMQMSVSYSNFKDWEAQNHVFESLGARRFSSFNLTGAGDPERVRGMMVSAGYFRALGAQAIHGRLFNSEEDQGTGQPVVVLSFALWVRRFGANADIASKSIVLDNKIYTVVGVLPADFAPGTTAQLYVPLSTLPEEMKTRDNHPGIIVVGRLKAGVNQAQAQSEMNNIATVLEKEYPVTNAHHQVTMAPMRDWIIGSVEYPLLTILAAVSLLLLIACANVSNLFLARATARKKEISVRIALGARRSRLVRQMLTESALVSVASGALGLLLAYWGVRMLVALKPSNLPRLAEIEVDRPVLLFTLGLSLLTAVLFGVVPALRSCRIGISDSLKDAGTRSTSGRDHQRMRYALVISEYALSVVLLVGAGLLVRSFAKLLGVNPAFAPHHLLTFSVDLPAEYRGESRLQFFDELQRRAQALPEAQSVTYAAGLPLIGTNESGFRLPGQNEMEGFESVEY